MKAEPADKIELEFTTPVEPPLVLDDPESADWIDDADIVVIGAGVTGLSTALHLEAAGVGRVALAGGVAAPLSGLASGVIAGGLVDNFTRVSHAHGADFAAELWRFGDLAYDAEDAAGSRERIAEAVGRIIRSARVNCFGLGDSAAEEQLGDVTARGRRSVGGLPANPGLPALHLERSQRSGRRRRIRAERVSLR